MVFCSSLSKPLSIPISLIFGFKTPFSTGKKSSISLFIKSGSSKNLPTPQAGSHIVIFGLISLCAIFATALTTFRGVKYCPQFFLLILSLRKVSNNLLLKSLSMFFNSPPPSFSSPNFLRILIKTVPYPFTASSSLLTKIVPFIMVVLSLSEALKSFLISFLIVPA